MGFRRGLAVRRKWTLVVVSALLVSVAIVDGRAASAANAGSSERAASGRQVEPLESAEAAEAVSAVPEGASSVPEEAVRPEKVRELPEFRSETADVWENSDGSRTVSVSDEPRNFQAVGSNEWQPIDTTLVVDEAQKDGGWLKSSANRWTARFGPSGSVEGMQLVETERGSISFSPVGAVAKSLVPERAGATATYRDLWPETDAIYAVTPTGTDERLFLKSVEASDAFEFEVVGATPRLRLDAGVDLLIDGTVVGVIPAPTVETAKGAVEAGEAGARFEVLKSERDEATALRLSVSRAWLDSLDGSLFPVVVDPTVTLNARPGTVLKSYSAAGGTLSGTTKAGTDTSNLAWRGAAYVPTPDPATVMPGGTQPWYLNSATLKATHMSGTGCAVCSLSVRGFTADPGSYSNVVNGQSIVPLETAGTPQNPIFQFDVSSYVAANPGAGIWYGFVGDEDPSHDLMHVLGSAGANGVAVDFLFFQSSPPTELVSPTGTISAATPTLTAAVVEPADPDSAWDTVYYDFKVYTGADGSGMVIDSGWLTSPSWTVPVGALADGVTYYVKVWDNIGTPWGAPNAYGYYPPAQPVVTRSFTIKAGLGAGGPSPTDTVGAVPGSTPTPSEGAPSPGIPPASLTVNMVTGNLSASVGTKTLPALGGSAGVSLNYDSMGAKSLDGAASGLYAKYTSGGQPLGQRIDPSIDFKWTGGSPIGGAANNIAVDAEWNGNLRLPASGTWRLGGWTGSGGSMTVYLNGSSTPYATIPAGGTSPTFGTTNLTAGISLGIRVTYSAGANATKSGQLWAYNTAAASTDPAQKLVVPGSWLKPRATGLPAGWRLSVDPGVGSWSRLDDLGSQVVVRSASGDTLAFDRLSDGSYRPHVGSTALLTTRHDEPWLGVPSGSDDSYDLDAGGFLFTFGEDGWVRSIRSLRDDRQPAALLYGYTTLTGAVGAPVLTSITDPVGNRSVQLCYPPGCAGGDPSWYVPDGMLGRINHWDGTVTELRYDSTSGQLNRIVSPGGLTADFGYINGRLTTIRDPLANAAVGANQRPDCVTDPTKCLYEIMYDTEGRVQIVDQPSPTQGAAKPRRVYDWSLVASRVSKVQIRDFVAGAYLPVLISTRAWDEKGRVVSQQDPAGRTTTTKWDPNIDRPVATVDPAGQQTTLIYDQYTHRLTDQYGPAPSSCFASTFPYAPLACGTPIPRTQHRYDEGLTGFAATFWDNPYLAGAPAKHATGFAATPGAGGTQACLPIVPFCAVWASPPVAPGGQSLPAPSTWTGNNWTWSARFSGSVSTSTPIALSVSTMQSVTVYLDGVYQQTVDAVESGLDGGVNFGIWNSNYYQVAIPAGTHQLQLDYRGSSTSLNGLYIYPTSGLSVGPDYGLETTTIDPDGKVTTTSYTDPAHGIGPEYGLSTSTTQDPGGLNLTSTTTYETPSTDTWLRPLAKSLPAGGTTTDNHYCGNSMTCGSGQLTGAIANTCGIATNAPQYGLLAEKLEPAQTPGGTRRSQQYVYDSAGRTAGRRVGPAASITGAPWQCTSYDALGRTTQQTWPAFNGAAARTATYNYTVGGNPLTASVTDPTGTITSTVDLLGRQTSYTDASGWVTTYTYDTPGRLTQTRSGPTTPNHLVTTYTYATNGDLTQVDVTIGSTPITAHIDYQPSGRIAGIGYSPGSDKRVEFTYDSNGRRSSLTHWTDGWVNLTDIATFSPAGRRTDARTVTPYQTTDPNPAGDDYVYDGAGRLTTAWLAGTRLDVDYANNPACTAAPNAGANTNRTSMTWTPTTGTPTTTGYCYNGADQLVSAADTPTGSFTYDDHGNQITDGTIAYTWDSADRLSTAQTAAAGNTITYTRDVLDRPLTRTETSLTRRYAYAGRTDTPAALLNGTTIIEDYVNLPGGVLVTVPTTGTRTWSYPNLQGHHVLTTDDDGGILTGIVTYDPWGNPYGGGGTINNTANNSDQAAYGSAGKLQEYGARPIVGMGARPDSTSRGRFLSVDPEQGGCANGYVYTHGDPVNTSDTSGKADNLSCWGFAYEREGLSFRGGVVDGQFVLTVTTNSPDEATRGARALIDYTPASFGARRLVQVEHGLDGSTIQPGVGLGGRGHIGGMSFSIWVQVANISGRDPDGMIDALYNSSVNTRLARFSCVF
jgi:RHS repeat-associated protein